ncbi:unnamed protein product [Lota lota]
MAQRLTPMGSKADWLSLTCRDWPDPRGERQRGSLIGWRRPRSVAACERRAQNGRSMQRNIGTEKVDPRVTMNRDVSGPRTMRRDVSSRRRVLVSARRDGRRGRRLAAGDGDRGGYCDRM